MTVIAPPPPAASSPVRKQRRPRRRMQAIAMLVAIACFLGVAILLFPTAAAWFMQYQQSQLIVGYSAEVTDLDAEMRHQAIDEAREYNAALTGGASVAAGERIPLAEGGTAIEGFAYDNLLAADERGLMARVKIPAINADLPIYHGTTDDVLQRGVGHLQGTALPVGGADTHSVLTAHRGLATAELFTNLDQVQVDDTFTIETFGEVLTYQVRETRVVQPHETETLFPQRGRDLVTLVTCTPLGINSHRILVTAERILPTPIEDIEAAGKPPEIPGFPWWALILGATAVVLVAYVWISSRPRTRTQQPDTPE